MKRPRLARHKYLILLTLILCLALSSLPLLLRKHPEQKQVMPDIPFPSATHRSMTPFTEPAPLTIQLDGPTEPVSNLEGQGTISAATAVFYATATRAAELASTATMHAFLESVP